MIVALVSSKGGVSKSTLAISMSWELSHRGARVRLVDADPQGTCRKAAAKAKEAIGAGVPRPDTISMGVEMYRPEQFPNLTKDFEHVVIDTPGRLGEVMKAALLVADVALVPVSPSGPDFDTLDDTLEVISRAQRGRPKLRVALVVTRQIPRSNLAAQAKEALRGLGVPVMEASTCNRVTWAEANTAGQGVAQYAPSSPAAGELRALVDELLAFPKGKSRR